MATVPGCLPPPSGGKVFPFLAGVHTKESKPAVVRAGGQRCRVGRKRQTANAVACLSVHEAAPWRFQDEGRADEEIRHKYGPQESTSGGGAGDPRAISFEGHRLQFDDFVRAIRTKGRPYCSGEDARAAVAVITSIYRSAQEGRKITVE